jgi:hypothetical protein
MRARKSSSSASKSLPLSRPPGDSNKYNNSKSYNSNNNINITVEKNIDIDANNIGDGGSYKDRGEDCTHLAPALLTDISTSPQWSVWKDKEVYER